VSFQPNEDRHPPAEWSARVRSPAFTVVSGLGVPASGQTPAEDSERSMAGVMVMMPVAMMPVVVMPVMAAHRHVLDDHELQQSHVPLGFAFHPQTLMGMAAAVLAEEMEGHMHLRGAGPAAMVAKVVTSDDMVFEFERYGRLVNTLGEGKNHVGTLHRCRDGRGNRRRGRRGDRMGVQATQEEGGNDNHRQAEVSHSRDLLVLVDFLGFFKERPIFFAL